MRSTPSLSELASSSKYVAVWNNITDLSITNHTFTWISQLPSRLFCSWMILGCGSELTCNDRRSICTWTLCNGPVVKPKTILLGGSWTFLPHNTISGLRRQQYLRTVCAVCGNLIGSVLLSMLSDRRIKGKTIKFLTISTFSCAKKVLNSLCKILQQLNTF